MSKAGLDKWAKAKARGATASPPNVKAADLKGVSPSTRAWCVRSSSVSRPDNPPGVAEGHEAEWERAKAIVKPRWDKYDEPYAVVMHVFQNIVGSK